MSSNSSSIIGNFLCFYTWAPTSDHKPFIWYTSRCLSLCHN